jgi:hypothetical protein
MLLLLLLLLLLLDGVPMRNGFMIVMSPTGIKAVSQITLLPSGWAMCMQPRHQHLD